MENKIPTAEEFLSDEIDRTAFPLIDNWLEDNNQEGQTLKDVLVKFVKLHLEAQAKAIIQEQSNSLEDGYDFGSSEIMNAYPLNLIK